MDKAATTKGGAPQTVRLKARVQKGFQLLRGLLEKAGDQDVTKRIARWDSVDDVMIAAPDLVPTLLAVAWELRHDGAFTDLFQALDGSGIVEDKNQPIAPCGRSFAQIIQSHLFACVRLGLDKAERDWSVKEARRAQSRWRKQQAEAPKGLLKGLFKREKEPVFDPADFRRRFPGHGLYEALKPHLKRLDQFPLVPAYVQLSCAQAEVLDDLLEGFNKPDQILFLASLTETDISVLRRCARIYANWKLFPPKPKKRPNQEDEPFTEEMARALAVEESRVFRDLMANHHQAMDKLKEMGPSAEKLIHMVAPIFRDRIWEIFADDTALLNVINTPEHLVGALGPFCRHVPPALSEILLQMNDQEVIKDILRFCRETFKEKDFAFYLSDPSRIPIWTALPKKFNNNFKYQRDAMKSNLIRNESDLRTVAAGIFESLRQGREL
ncbi:MAG: hypothetical protein K9H25_12130 [Rhodospirillum sp.]|nr:hypothetical protein [Rhodospirillum sp.]MCF8490000.1 hypothetical protein [Rhodospirillum sp.]MCF8498835.1 hypothetical protein [Rhodospirillum sp.]